MSESNSKNQGGNRVTLAQKKVAVVAGGMVSAANIESLSGAQIEAHYQRLLNGSPGEVQGDGVGLPGRDSESRDGKQPEGEPKGLAGLKRKVATTSQLREVIEQILASSENLSSVVREQLVEMKDELRGLLGVDDAINEATQKLLEMLTGTQAEQQESLLEWMQSVEEKATTTMRVILPDLPVVEVKDQHEKFADLLFNSALRIPSLLVGPTGSGKTRAGMEVAKALKLPYSYIAMAPTQTEGKLSGFVNATGYLVPSEFYLAYKYGGVVMLDELDAGNEGVTLWMNGAIQNRVAAFPRGFMTRLEHDGYGDEAEEFKESFEATGGMVRMHEDSVILASANTYGKGADMMYVGRRPIDAATFKRFKFIIWDYDEKLELKISPLDEWTRVVQAVRRCVQDRRMNHAVSTVDSIDGGRMILAGKPWQTVANETIFAGLQKDEIDKLINDTTHKNAINAALNKLRNWEVKRNELDVKDDSVQEKAAGL